jgi:DNA recombination protein RmuC
MDIGILLLVGIAIGVLAILWIQVIALRSNSGAHGMEEAVREELRLSRQEASTAASDLRVELRGQLQQGTDSVTRAIAALDSTQDKRMAALDVLLGEFRKEGQDRQEAIRGAIEVGLKSIVDAQNAKAEEMRRDASAAHSAVIDLLSKELAAVTNRIDELVQGNATALNGIRDVLGSGIKDLQAGVEAKVSDMRTEVAAKLKDLDEHLAKDLSSARESQQASIDQLTRRVGEVAAAVQTSLDTARKTIDERLSSLTAANQEALDRVSNTLSTGMTSIQASNEKKLEEMRATVDEKLQSTLEKRLSDSFRLVSDRLEAVQLGLGEMQTLAAGVGDLKRVLTNVKARGTWAEVQLGAILEQILTPDQYAKNVAVRPGSAERVEFAIRLPGAGNDMESRVWLPIDSKFPQEDYVRLQEAAEKGDADAQRSALEGLTRAIRASAKDIHDKYVAPPHSTDFAIMFLPTEGLYAEVARTNGLIDELQIKYRVTVVGPANLAAFLCAIRMGFQSIAIQRRADDVWKVLGAVKTEFGKFGDVLDRVYRQLETASRTIQQTHVRTRMMQRSLKDVEALPETEAASMLGDVAEAMALTAELEGMEQGRGTPESATAEGS